MRSFWKGDEGRMTAELAYRLTGSPDLYQHSGRRPYASINFVTAHDGFTLNDLVSYNEKHNEANGEREPRRRQQQSLLELMASKGRPMIRRFSNSASSSASTHAHDAPPFPGRADDHRRR